MNVRKAPYTQSTTWLLVSFPDPTLRGSGNETTWLPYSLTLLCQHYAGITKPPIMPKAMPACCACSYWSLVHACLWKPEHFPSWHPSWCSLPPPPIAIIIRNLKQFKSSLLKQTRNLSFILLEQFQIFTSNKGGGWVVIPPPSTNCGR